MFTSLPQHHLRDVDVYSLAEIEAVHSGQLFHRLEPIVQYCLYHIEGCPVGDDCVARYFYVSTSVSALFGASFSLPMVPKR
jgi:hypothetical protein